MSGGEKAGFTRPNYKEMTCFQAAIKPGDLHYDILMKAATEGKAVTLTGI